MYQVGERVVYGIHGVCTIVDVEVRKIDRQKVEYFALEPWDQPGARFYVPTRNPAALSKLRYLLESHEIQALLDAQVPREWISDEGKRKLYYKELMNSTDCGALLSMVGALYRHREHQAASGRKFHVCDENFLRDAQKILCSEISLVMEMDHASAKQYLLSKLSCN